MAGGGGGGGSRSLEVTPTWASAFVCFVLVLISIIIEHIIHLIAQWLKKNHKTAVYEALEKVKSELMLLGFMSLLLTVSQGSITRVCIRERVADTWTSCSKNHGTRINKDRRILAADGTKGCGQGKVPFISTEAIHQLHIFIFVLAVFHVLSCVLTMTLGKAKMRRWKRWEEETKTAEYQFSNDPERFRFTRETSFGKRHLSCWTTTPILIWIVCFFRQFCRSVPKVDYMTLRHGFVMAHLSPQSHTNFDFQKYINRSLEKDFKVVVGISPPIWLFAVLFLLFNTHGWYSYLWLPFIPLIISLVVGTKLQVIITKMGIRIQERGEIVKGLPVVQPGDDLFWFNRPRLLIYLINFVLFQIQFGISSCFHEQREDIIIRICMGILIQILCSYVTLPLYALVTQMGSSMKPAIFNERVATALKRWHETAKKNIKHRNINNSKLHSVTSMLSSRPSTASSHHPSPSRSPSPFQGNSPVHLLQRYKSNFATSTTASYHDVSPVNPAHLLRQYKRDLNASTLAKSGFFHDWGTEADDQSCPIPPTTSPSPIEAQGPSLSTVPSQRNHEVEFGELEHVVDISTDRNHLVI
ncbi:hypothetical protein Ancab_021633 [Ancistrocladus abbreviatus]